MRRLLPCLCVLIATLGLAGCGGKKPEQQDTVAASSPAKSSPEESYPGESYPGEAPGESAPAKDDYVPPSVEEEYPGEAPGESAPAKDEYVPPDVDGSAPGGAPYQMPQQQRRLPAPKPLTLKERSVLAFESGNTLRAFDLLNAVALTGDESDLVDIANKYRWNPAAKRPALGVRIAVGMRVDNPAKLTDLKPIGTELQAIMPGGGGGGGGGGMDSPVYTEDYSMGGGMISNNMNMLGSVRSPAEAMKPLTKAAGKLATELMTAMGTLHREGKWTLAFQENSFKGIRNFGAIGPGAGLGMPGYNGAGDGYIPDAGPRFFHFQSGGGPAVGAIAGAASNGTLIPGKISPETDVGNDYPGEVYPGETPMPGDPSVLPMPYGGVPAQQIPNLVPEDFKLAEGITPIGPCIDFIGEGEQRKLLQQAYDSGYDLLVFFEVDVSLNRRNGVVTNTAKGKILTVADDIKETKVVASVRQLTNVNVARALQKEEDDGVNSALKPVVDRLTETELLYPIPANLTPDGIIKSRIPRLLADEGLSKIAKLGEIQFYYAKGYLDETQRSEYFQTIAGDVAEKLLASNKKTREEAVKELLAGG